MLGPFVTLQKDDSGIMAVVQAVHHDLEKAKAPVELVSAVDRILVNEAEVAIKTVLGKDGKASKKAVKSASQEALRAEIAKDGRALLDLGAIHPALEKRKVDGAPRREEEGVRMHVESEQRRRAPRIRRPATTTFCEALLA